MKKYWCPFLIACLLVSGCAESEDRAQKAYEKELEKAFYADQKTVEGCSVKETADFGEVLSSEYIARGTVIGYGCPYVDEEKEIVYTEVVIKVEKWLTGYETEYFGFYYPGGETQELKYIEKGIERPSLGTDLIVCTDEEQFTDPKYLWPVDSKGKIVVDGNLTGSDQKQQYSAKEWLESIDRQLVRSDETVEKEMQGGWFSWPVEPLSKLVSDERTGKYVVKGKVVGYGKPSVFITPRGGDHYEILVYTEVILQVENWIKGYDRSGFISMRWIGGETKEWGYHDEEIEIPPVGTVCIGLIAHDWSACPELMRMVDSEGNVTYKHYLIDGKSRGGEVKCSADEWMQFLYKTVEETTVQAE